MSDTPTTADLIKAKNIEVINAQIGANTANGLVSQKQNELQALYLQQQLESLQ